MTNLWNAFAANAKVDLAAPALIFGDAVCSFGELKALAERCATALAARGVLRGDVIALQLPKRPVAYALLLACLRLGAPYVFLDPKNPPQRTARIVAQLRPKILFSENDTSNPFGEALNLASAGNKTWLADASRMAEDATPSTVKGTDPAYIMFTSGSTGIPKGVAISHGSVLNFVAWARSIFGIGPGDVVANANPIYFDNSVFDFYAALFSGACLAPIGTGELGDAAAFGGLEIGRAVGEVIAAWEQAIGERAATVRDVRVIGPIVRMELCADGRPANEPLEAEISRERFDIDRFHIGQNVGVRFRRWQLYPANAALVSGAAA